MPGSRTNVPRAMRRSRRYRASKTMTITYQTPPPSEFKRMVEATPSGMAYWADTGPPGTVCGQCSFYMQHTNSCSRYYEGMKQRGAPFPAETPSCLYFQPPKMGL
jgi:hypothetical protein